MGKILPSDLCVKTRMTVIKRLINLYLIWYVHSHSFERAMAVQNVTQKWLILIKNICLWVKFVQIVLNKHDFFFPIIAFCLSKMAFWVVRARFVMSQNKHDYFGPITLQIIWVSFDGKGLARNCASLASCHLSNDKK